MSASPLRLALPVMLLAAVPSFALTRYVDVNSTNPVAPYTNWATAANVIQDAVDAAADGDTVLVTNGVYTTGGGYASGSNRVKVLKPILLQSVNGPTVTTVQGYQLAGVTNGWGALRCLYLGNCAAAVGFTLTGGATSADRDGGGAYCASTSVVLSNCVILGNSASRYGGGVYSGTLYDCIVSSNTATHGGGASYTDMIRCQISHNSAEGGGGGIARGKLTNSFVIGNSARSGGGISVGSCWNCTIVGNSASGSNGGIMQGNYYNTIIYYNTAQMNPNWEYGGGFLRNCCSFPEGSYPISVRMITNAPLFVDTNNWADLRLQPNSACINAGNNAYVTATNDLDGNPRIVGGTVDMGAYEYQTPSSVISYAYLQQYGLPTDGSVDDLDVDNDNATTWQEWKMWTDPTNGLSVLRLLNPDPGTNGTVVSWQSVSNHSYLLERASNPAAPFSLLQSNIAGLAGTTTFTDTTAMNGESFFYRVSVPE